MPVIIGSCGFKVSCCLLEGTIRGTLIEQSGLRPRAECFWVGGKHWQF